MQGTFTRNSFNSCNKKKKQLFKISQLHFSEELKGKFTSPETLFKTSEVEYKIEENEPVFFLIHKIVVNNINTFVLKNFRLYFW